RRALATFSVRIPHNSHRGQHEDHQDSDQGPRSQDAQGEEHHRPAPQRRHPLDRTRILRRLKLQQAGRALARARPGEADRECLSESEDVHTERLSTFIADVRSTTLALTRDERFPTSQQELLGTCLSRFFDLSDPNDWAQPLGLLYAIYRGLGEPTTKKAH